MQFYSAKVRLSGSTMNEVRDIFSAPEILLMQFIHGGDAISEIKLVREERKNMAEFKDMLKAKYDQALVKRKQSIDGIFGALGQLPTKLPENLLEKYDIIDEDDAVAVAKSVTRADKNQANHLPQNDLEAQRLDRVIPASEVNMDDIME